MLPVYVRTGLLWEGAEIHWLERFLAAVSIEGREPLAVLDLPVADLYGDHWSLSGRGVPGYDNSLDSNYLPGRNLLLLSKVAVLCAVRGIGRIAMAPLVDNPFSDGTPAFFAAFASAASMALSAPLRVETPFRGLDKAEVVQRGAGLPLALTFSCIRPEGFDHCGECTKCAERQRAFGDAAVTDPTVYRRRHRSLGSARLSVE